jgi:hypothetical protein
LAVARVCYAVFLDAVSNGAGYVLRVRYQKRKQQRYGLATGMTKKPRNLDDRLRPVLNHLSPKISMSPETVDSLAMLTLPGLLEYCPLKIIFVLLERFERKTRYDHGCLSFC